MIATAFLVMQFIISAKAGLVNAVDGTANVRVQEQVAAGAPIQTGTGRVEILLNPGTFLRLDEDSEAVLDSVDLTDIQVRLLSGSAIVDSTNVEKDSPIRVTYGTETLTISKPGIYRIPEDATSASLDDWSQQRSMTIAAANARAADTDAALNGQGFQTPGLLPYGGYPGALLPSSPYSPYSVTSGFGLARGPFSYFSSYGGYSFYQPFVTPFPLLNIVPVRPVLIPSPRPTTIFPRPTLPTTTATTRPAGTSVPRPMPTARPAARAGGHGHR